MDLSKREDLRVQAALRWAEDLPELPLIFNLEISTIAQRLLNVLPRLGSGGANAITWNIEQWGPKVKRETDRRQPHLGSAEGR